MAVPTHIVAGFLGAGKTTVVRHWLKTLPGRTGIVVNDFGEAGIDGALLSGGSVREIAASCVCCTAPAGFVAAVTQLLDDGVDRIVVEPTGIARPADLVDTLRRSPVAARLDLRPLVVVVDPTALAAGRLPADAAEQAEAADVFVATHADVASEDDVAAARRWAAELWPGPHAVYAVAHGAVPTAALDWPPGRGPRATEAHDHDHPDHGYVVRSWSWAPDHVFHRGRLRAGLDALAADRVKGLFRTDEGFVLLQKAGGRLHEETTGWRTDSRTDVISREASTLEAAHVLFEKAFLLPEEAAARGHLLEVAAAGGSRTFDRAALAALPGPGDVSVVAPGRAGAAVWLEQVLGEVSPDAELVVVAADGYVTDPVPVRALGGAVLVHTLGDGPLPANQGGPFRLLVPGSATACANVKGVVRLAIR
jgi:G3E family GTPase